nr:hypothetical protein GCM10020241_06350 [Streptoalloteichus tenebrarius]
MVEAAFSSLARVGADDPDRESERWVLDKAGEIGTASSRASARRGHRGLALPLGQMSGSDDEWEPVGGAGRNDKSRSGSRTPVRPEEKRAQSRASATA